MNRVEIIVATQRQLRNYFDRGYDENEAYCALQRHPVLRSVRLAEIKNAFEEFRAEVEEEKCKQRADTPTEQFRQNVSRFLFFSEELRCEDSLQPCVRSNYLSNWNGRFAFWQTLPRNNNGSRELHIFDWFNNTSANVTFEARADDLRRLFPLNDYFGLVFENSVSAPNVYHISFVELDVYKKEFQTIQTVVRELLCPYVCPDVANPVNFALYWYSTDTQLIFSQPCSFNESGIKFGDIVQVENNSKKILYSYFNGRHYWLQIDREIEEHVQSLELASILIYNAETDENVVIPLHPLPRHVFYDGKRRNAWTGTWARGQVFMPVRFKLSNDYGIAFTDPNRKDWTVMDLCFEMPIVGLEFSGGRELMIDVQDTTVSVCGHNIRREVYKIPLKKPGTLRSMAWFALVRKMKERGHDDPYKEALQWLPFNSDIRFPA